MPVRPLPAGYGSILASEADGTPVTEVRSRTRTWRRCRIVLGSGGCERSWPAVPPFCPGRPKRVARSRHRRPNRSSRPGLEPPAPGRRDLANRSGEHRDADDFAGGDAAEPANARRRKTLGRRRLRSLERLRRRRGSGRLRAGRSARKRLNRSRGSVPAAARGVFAFCASAESVLPGGQMQTAGQGSCAAFCGGRRGVVCKRSRHTANCDGYVSAPAWKRIKPLCRVEARRTAARTPTQRTVMLVAARAIVLADFRASDHQKHSVIRGIDHVAIHRGFRERIRAAVIGHRSGAIAAVYSSGRAGCRSTCRATQRLQQTRNVAVPSGAARIPAPLTCRRRSSPRTASSRRSRSRPRATRRSIASTCIRRCRSIQAGNSDMTAGPEEHGVILQQFARFASVCRVYAPLYRQVTLTALRSDHWRQANACRSRARRTTTCSTRGTTISRTTTAAAASCSSATRRARAC